MNYAKNRGGYRVKEFTFRDLYKGFDRKNIVFGELFESKKEEASGTGIPIMYDWGGDKPEKLRLVAPPLFSPSGITLDKKRKNNRGEKAKRMTFIIRDDCVAVVTENAENLFPEIKDLETRKIELERLLRRAERDQKRYEAFFWVMDEVAKAGLEHVIRLTKKDKRTKKVAINIPKDDIIRSFRNPLFHSRIEAKNEGEVIDEDLGTPSESMTKGKVSVRKDSAEDGSGEDASEGTVSEEPEKPLEDEHERIFVGLLTDFDYRDKDTKKMETVKAKFTDPDGEVIPWKYLEGVKLSVSAIIQFSWLWVAKERTTIRTELRGGTVVEHAERVRQDSQKENRQAILEEDPDAAERVKSRVAAWKAEELHLDRGSGKVKVASNSLLGDAYDDLGSDEEDSPKPKGTRGSTKDDSKGKSLKGEERGKSKTSDDPPKKSSKKTQSSEDSSSEKKPPKNKRPTPPKKSSKKDPSESNSSEERPRSKGKTTSKRPSGDKSESLTEGVKGRRKKGGVDSRLETFMMNDGATDVS